MLFKEKLSKYAKLIVKSGLNVQTDQIVVIDAPVESVELVRMITKKLMKLVQKKLWLNTAMKLFHVINMNMSIKMSLVMYQLGLVSLEMDMLVKMQHF